MAKKREPAWATRLRDLRRDFVAANKRSRLRFVLVQTIGASVKGLQPSVDENCSPMRTAVTLGDGTPAIRWVYRFGRDDDPAISLIERGNDILNRHGDEILQLFSLKFVDSSEGNWPWLLARLAEVEHPFRGDIKSDRTLAGVASPNEMAEAVAFTLGQGPKPSWLAERNKSFRADIPHVAVASIAVIRAILERVAAVDAETLGDKKQKPKVDGPLKPDGFRLNGIEVWGLVKDWQKTLTFVWKRTVDPPKWSDVTTHLGLQGTMTESRFAKFIYNINQHVKERWKETLQTVEGDVVLRVPLPPKSRKSPGSQAKTSSAKKSSRNTTRKSMTTAVGMTPSKQKKRAIRK